MLLDPVPWRGPQLAVEELVVRTILWVLQPSTKAELGPWTTEDLTVGVQTICILLCSLPSVATKE